MTNSSLVRIGIAFLVIATTLGCGKETERDKIGDAQICLDGVTNANPDEADNCLAKISDISSPAADGIRCAGAFVKEGFTDASVLINAFQTISGGVSNSNLGSFLSYLIFDGRNSSLPNNVTTSNTYYTQAKTSSGYCASANLKVGTLITTFAFLGNAIVKLGCDAGTTCGQSLFSSISSTGTAAMIAIISYIGNSGNATAVNQLYSDLGTLVINSYAISCVGTIIDPSLCNKISQSVTSGGGTSNPTGVGQKFLQVILGLP